MKIYIKKMKNKGDGEKYTMINANVVYRTEVYRISIYILLFVISDDDNSL